MLGFSFYMFSSPWACPMPVVLFYLKSSLWSSDLYLTFLCSIFVGFSLPCLLLLLLSHFSRVQLCATPQTVAHQASRPWDSPGKNTGVGCYFLLQCMKVKNESEVAQLCLTLINSMDCSLPGSSIHGIFQARALE